MRWIACVLVSVVGGLLVACGGGDTAKSPSPVENASPVAAASSISEADLQKMIGLARGYVVALRLGAQNKALALMLSADAASEQRVAHDLATIEASTEAGYENETRVYWLDGTALMPPGNDARVTSQETARLGELGGEYPVASFVTFESMSGETLRFFAVQVNGDFRLLP